MPDDPTGRAHALPGEYAADVPRGHHHEAASPPGIAAPAGESLTDLTSAIAALRCRGAPEGLVAPHILRRIASLTWPHLRGAASGRRS